MRIAVVRAATVLTIATLAAFAARAAEAPEGGSSRTPAAQEAVPPSIHENLQKLHARNQAEIRTALIAQKRALSASVAELARLVEVESRRIDEQLRDAARRLQVDLEGETYQAELRRVLRRADEHLGVKQGQAFDRAYTALLVSDQREDLDRDLDVWIADAQAAGRERLADELQQVRRTVERRLALAERVDDLERRQSAAASRSPTSGPASETSTSAIGDDPGGFRRGDAPESGAPPATAGASSTEGSGGTAPAGR